MVDIFAPKYLLFVSSHIIPFHFHVYFLQLQFKQPKEYPIGADQDCFERPAQQDEIRQELKFFLSHRGPDVKDRLARPLWYILHEKLKITTPVSQPYRALAISLSLSFLDRIPSWRS